MALLTKWNYFRPDFSESQVEPEEWLKLFEELAIAEAILD